MSSRADWGGEPDGPRFTAADWHAPAPETGIPGVEAALGKPVVGIVDEKAGGIVAYIIADCEPDALLAYANAGFDAEEGA